MSIAETDRTLIPNADGIRDQWVARVTELVDQAEEWARELGWATRRIDKRLDDYELGTHRVPALLLQEGTTRLILEPIGRSAGEIEGVVDLYLMPAYDDAARLFFHNGGWHFDFVPAGEARFTGVDAPLTQPAFHSLLEELVRHGA